MTLATTGLHHVTATASDARINVDFYLRTIGLRLVKTTVNFDAPSVCHLYHGEEQGQARDADHVLSLRGG
ncbi:VOC family protein [Kribbella turkmenica]|uniref:VOC family protein n=1 Tax=Kribbella turkmenica TaxID=2530375 RepID=UPI00192D694E|nr:VOC family protein [Kribbella turkmenica]